jgi:TolA-binding protein
MMTILQTGPDLLPELLLQLKQRIAQYQQQLQQMEDEVTQLRLLHWQLKQVHQASWRKFQQATVAPHTVIMANPRDGSVTLAAKPKQAGIDDSSWPRE